MLYVLSLKSPPPSASLCSGTPSPNLQPVSLQAAPAVPPPSPSCTMSLPYFPISLQAAPAVPPLSLIWMLAWYLWAAGQGTLSSSGCTHKHPTLPTQTAMCRQVCLSLSLFWKSNIVLTVNGGFAWPAPALNALPESSSAISGGCLCPLAAIELPSLPARISIWTHSAPAQAVGSRPLLS